MGLPRSNQTPEHLKARAEHVADLKRLAKRLAKDEQALDRARADLDKAIVKALEPYRWEVGAGYPGARFVPDRLTVSDVARAAGLSRQSIYQAQKRAKEQQT